MTLPHVSGDQSLAFLREGYRFGQHRFDPLDADGFTTRLMGRRVTFLRGSDAARFFYEGGRFTRDRALPTSVLHSLQDEGSVQTLVGGRHHSRKGMFLNLMTPDSLATLASAFRGHWMALSREWAQRDAVILHLEAARVLTRAACTWAGISLSRDDEEARTGEFLAMIDFAGSLGIPNWIARARRRRTEAWARDAIAAARAGHAPPDSPLAIIARHRDEDGEPLGLDVAAVELLNILRPTVAVGRFIVFAAWALHRHPEWRARFEAGDDSRLSEFVEEVRRFAPFFPAVGGRAALDLEWAGHEFAADDWVMLDLFATNRHPRLWRDPERFDPGRFAVAVDPNALIPQGGGEASDGHRCPGEAPTVDLLAEAVKLLARSMTYDVPPQDLRVNLRRIPGLPESAMIISGVQLR